MFFSFILIKVVVLQTYSLIKINCTMHLRFVHFIVRPKKKVKNKTRKINVAKVLLLRTLMV